MDNNISSLDALVASLEYYVTEKGSENAVTRVRVPEGLVNLVSKEMAKKSDYTVKPTNKLLITYALLNLLDPTVLEQLRYKLDQGQKEPNLSKLLSIKKDPRQQRDQVTDQKLIKIQQSIDELRQLTYGELNNSTWLVRNRIGVDMSPAITKEDNDAIYARLRDDKCKATLNEVILAGKDEDDRQRHLHTI